ncbi:cytochrome P450 6a8-like [Episyrphus balteatus]|uniref:cytochrome P450 6a8-like n=1 Tax=Episyrphus balteatus TaxID=286459 RepID=UPI002486127D|nr:cytochrome P450 6a8-like [Episyrphus balteatus]
MAFFSVFLCIIIILITTLAYYVRSLLTFWKRRGIPHDPPTFPQGNLVGHPTEKHMKEIVGAHYHKYKSQGPFAGFYFFLNPAILMYDLDLIRDIFIKDFNNFTGRGIFHNEKDDPLTGNLLNLEGAKWKDMRSKMSPTFTSGKMKFMFPTVVSVAERLVEAVGGMVEKDPDFEVKDIVARFTVDVIGNVGFGIECNSLKDPHAEFRQMGDAIGNLKRHSIFVSLFMFSFPDLARKLRLKQTHDDVEAFFMRIVRETVDYREKNSIKRNDFMNLLLEIKHSGESMSIEEIAAQVFIFFLAGSETSSTTMGHALYELAKNPEIQDKLREEIESLIEKHDGVLSYDCLMEMTYMEKVFKETLRKYPVITNLVRRSMNEYPTKNPKFVIPANTMCLIPVDAIHHDPEIYPDPEKFDPERFSPEEISKRHSCSWLPFGEGPRHCIGLRFGKMQTSIGLALLIKNFKFSHCDKTPSQLEFNPKSIILVSKGGIHLRAERV